MEFPVAGPKVQLLAWRACQEAILVCCNLRRKGLHILTACMRCGNEAEDVLHVLLRCSFARQVWALSSLPWRWINLEVRPMEDWKQLKGPDFSLFLLICWNLWTSGNQLAFEVVSLSPLEVIPKVQQGDSSTFGLAEPGPGKHPMLDADEELE
ncbi:hypothetical protein Sango_1935700 [Sesamum angolense]|uniref:Reverse transcriptase zinc-binding domain-containing protein n=1 Tax=Sesamum angolense TaxID=2727404 RepID=A0AAE2BN77_9LAMI|nr:hypothetical protein Sango_1935700 [Sesamum angolense]